jgi:internalin A
MESTDYSLVREAKLRIQAAITTGARALDLSGLWVGKSPESIGKMFTGLKQVRHLNMRSNVIYAHFDWVCQLTLLETLDLSDNHLTDLPECFGQLQRLRELNISQNKLTTLPTSIAQLTRVKNLDLSGNRLAYLPQSIGELVQLHHLDVSRNHVSDIAESLGELKELRSFDVSDNQLETLPPFVIQCTKLESLNISANQLDVLPKSLGDLTHLKRLDVSKNQLTKLPKTLGQLSQLESLDISSNRLDTLPESLAELTQLENFDASDNQITKLPDSYCQLSQLRALELRSNRLPALPKLLGRLSKPKCLDASANRLTELPESLRELPLLLELYLHGNSDLCIPAEVFGPGREDIGVGRKARAAPASILDYYFRIRSGRRALNEAKLILVGRGGVGKTCLVNRLLHDKFEHQEETPGIAIRPWEIEMANGDRVRLHVWDFGGQRILHGTHQFFLTERTIYLLVLSGREDSATQDAEYWLQLIRSFGSDSKVIVALNKSSEHPFDINRGLLLEKYSFIAEFVKTDCADATGLSELKHLIYEQTDALEHRKAAFPSEWFGIKERLAGMEENFVTWEQYQAICRGSGENDPNAQRELARFLHILGIALHYADDPRLHDTRVLKPTWVTEGIYTVLRAGQREDRGGVLCPSDLAKALDPKQYPASKHDFLLRLLERFQLCFRLPGPIERYLVPELLGENQPEIKTLLDAPGLGFRYQFEVLPEGLLPRFIVQTQAYSEGNPEWRWRTGVVLARDRCQAVVRADARERRVNIYVTGSRSRRRELLAVIREKFDEQRRDLKGLVVDERVPVPGEKDPSGKEVTVSYRHLLDLEEDGEEEYRPEGMRTPVRVEELLNGVESKESRAARRMQQKFSGIKEPPTLRKHPKRHVFLSYCHDNASEVAVLRDGLIAAEESVWWDQDIIGGRDWKQEIRRAIKDAYAIVLCLSKELSARAQSGVYPEVVDAISAFRSQAPGSVFLIPVRLSACEVPDIEIDDTRTLDRLQCIDLFPDSDRVEGLGKLLQAVRASPNHP